MTITVNKGSYAQQYCAENNLRYTYPDSLDWLSEYSQDQTESIYEEYNDKEAQSTGTIAASCNVRSGPGYDYSVIAGIAAGERVIIVDDIEDGWWHIQTDGIDGYILGKFLGEVEYADNKVEQKDELKESIGFITGDEVNVRSDHNSADDDNVMFTLFEGDEVTILESVDGWYKIEVDGETGWIMEGYVE